MASNTAILGAAGEHYVMYRLLSLNLVAALAPPGVPTADPALASNLVDVDRIAQHSPRHDSTVFSVEIVRARRRSEVIAAGNRVASALREARSHLASFLPTDPR